MPDIRDDNYEFEMHKTDFKVMTFPSSSNWGTSDLGASEIFKCPWDKHVRIEGIWTSKTGAVSPSNHSLAVARTMGGLKYRNVEGSPDVSTYVAYTEWQEENYFDWQQGNGPYSTNAQAAIDIPRSLYTLMSSFNANTIGNILNTSTSDIGGHNPQGIWLQPNDALYLWSSNNYASYYGGNYIGQGDMQYPTIAITYTEFY